MTNHLPPDTDHQNEVRAQWAGEAIDMFQIAAGCDADTALPDLLADIMHWCDRNSVNFDSELDSAYRHYALETEEEEIAA